MTKIFLVLFFSLAFIDLSAAEVSIPKNIQISKNLENRISDYWGKRAENDFKSTYSIELPYLNYIHSRKWYKKCFHNAATFSNVDIIKVFKCDSEICTLGLELTDEDTTDSKIFIKDKWINIDNTWYHRYDDSPLP